MKTSTALNIIDNIVQKAVNDYKENPDNQIKDSNGNVIGYKSSPLLNITKNDECFQLGLSLINIALQTVPISLLEDVATSTATELKLVSKDKFVRVPKTPTCSDNNEELDIDDALAYAVIYDTLANLDQTFSQYSQKSSIIVMNYNNAYKGLLADILAGNTGTDETVYVRFSADGENWHSNYQDGDIYISFKRDTGDWTPSIKFVGDDGKPCSDTNFTELKDTPSSYSGNKGKVVAVNDSEDGLVFIDASSGSGATKFTDLTDTPSQYNNAGDFVVVNANKDGLDFKTGIKFTELTDTPATLTANKYVAVDSNGTALTLVDAPSSSGGGVFYTEDSNKTITIDLFSDDIFTFYPQDDNQITIALTKDSNSEYAIQGKSYKFNFIIGKNDVTFDDDSGNIIYSPSIAVDKDNGSDTGVTLTTFTLTYLGGGYFVVSNREVINGV